MREYRSADGEWRIWYDAGEIDRIVEDELRDAGLMPTVASPVTDLETLVEGHLRCGLDQYRPLPPEVLGVTEFPRGKEPVISLNEDLTGSALDDEDAPAGLVGRWRATLAHEVGHVLLHRALFELDDLQGELFPHREPQRESSRPCLKRDVGHGRGGRDWREVQANQAMAAILMPGRVFRRLVRATANDLDLGVAGLKEGSQPALSLAQQLARRLEVSRQAAMIRLHTAGFLQDPKDQTLGPL